MSADAPWSMIRSAALAGLAVVLALNGLVLAGRADIPAEAGEGPSKSDIQAQAHRAAPERRAELVPPAPRRTYSAAGGLVEAVAAPELPSEPERSAPAPDAPAVPALPAPVPLVSSAPRLAAFAGLSTWVDLYDTGLSPQRQVELAAAGGVQTVFVQTARFNSPADIHDPARLAALIDAAHDRGLRVMTWYIPDFVDLSRDYRRSQAAMAFVTPRGDRPDAFGLDIETEHVEDAGARTEALLALSQALRHWVGPDYPMAAIVLPPLQLDLRPSWWPDFPYAQLRAHYDVFIPMSYSSLRGRDAETTYRWNLGNVLELRRRAGDENLAVHLAGGIADGLDELEAFLAAARDAALLGGGLYDLHTTRPEAWHHLRALRTP